MASNLTIRPFSPADQQAVSSLILEGLGEHFDTINPALNPDLDNIFASYVNPGFLFVVCETDRKLVGTGALIPEMAGTGRIVRVSVANSHRRQGIGRLITDYLINVAPEHGYNQLVVETNEDWFDAIRLYQQCGFIECDRRDGEVHMIKILSAVI